MEPIVVEKKPEESIERLVKLEGTYKIHVGLNGVIIESMDRNRIEVLIMNEFENEPKHEVETWAEDNAREPIEDLKGTGTIEPGSLNPMAF